MTKFLYTGLLIIIGLLSSCSQKETSDILNKIEGYMEVHPDSALLLLNEIPEPGNLHGKQSADYALLLTQARDKNFLDSLQSDSLIKIAVDYYQDSDDKVKAGKALFYYGKVMDLQENDTLAMQAYLKAQTKLEKSKEYKLQGLIQEYIGRINDDRAMYDTALENYQKSAYYYQKVGDTLGVVYSYKSIAWIYEIKQNSDSVIWYVKTGISLLKGDSLLPIYPSLMQLLGEQERKMGNYSQAVNSFQSAIRNERIPFSIHYYYLSLGDVYMQLGEFQKAKEYFEKALNSTVNFTKSGAYNYLYLLEKQKGNYAEALSYKEKSDSLLKIYQEENLRDQILTIQRKYETERLEMDKVILVQEKKEQLYFWISVSSLLVTFGVFFYFWIKKQYRRIYRKRLKAHIEKALETIKENERVIGQYICQIETLKQEGVSVVELAERQIDDLHQRICDLENKNGGYAKDQIAKLNQKIQILVSENKAIREDSCVGGIYVLEQLKKGKLIIENMTRKEKNQVFEYIDLLFGGFVSKMKEEFGLNENNLMLAILVKLDFTSTELMVVFQCEKNSIFKKKQRLRDKLLLKNDDELDAFLTSYPLILST